MRARLLAVLLGLVAATVVVPATSSPAQAAGGARTAVITFHKNYRNAHRSTLTWVVYRTVDGRRTTVVTKSWRAGSGFLRSSTDACRKNRGWLPDGRYRPRLFADYGGSVVKGRAIYLGNKACGNGTVRNDLFIHTEQDRGNRQCADRKGDQACRWEHPRFPDYQSYGCVKMSPGDLRELTAAWRRYFPLGSPAQVRVVVR